MNLDASGIEHHRGGIIVDAGLRTSNRRVYAIGDVAGGLQFTHVAGYHAGVIIRSMLFCLPAKEKVDHIPWATYTDPELAQVGLTEAQAREKFGTRLDVARFNFSGSDQQKKVGVLSGGERNRLHLAMTLKTEANVLLLDEPTNDIDVNTLRALEEGIENFSGCAVVISHDRWFLDRICTHILAFEGDSEVYFFEGSYSDYEENRKKRLGADIIPQRIKYKKLTR